MFRRIKEILRRLLLRGAVFDWWIRCKARLWERAYCAELVRSSRQPVAPPIAPSRRSSAPLRNILLIADCMWEQNDLVPQFKKIAGVQLLDLRPALKAGGASRLPHRVVTETVEAHLRNANYPEPDVILFYARPTLLSDAVFDLLRRRWSCPLLGMNLDDKLQFFPYGLFSVGDDNYQKWARKFDLNISNCFASTEWYRERGLPCIYSPQGVHITDDLSPPTSSRFKYEFSFLGTIKPERSVVINRLLAAGVPIQLFGAGWPNTRWVDNPNEVYRDTQINLGIGFASPSLTLTTIKGRDFECTGLGACYLTTYNWELLQHWELEKEILCYRSVEELIEMYAYYRKRPEECLKIAQAAWRRAINEHTWEHRFRRIFREVGFKV